VEAGDGIGPADELIRRAGHGRDDHRHLMAGIDLPLDPHSDRFDAVDIGQGGAAKLHHDAGLAGRSRHRSESRGMLAAAPRPLPDGRRVSILNWNAAKQGLRR
jgi:hypothetical protein